MNKRKIILVDDNETLLFMGRAMLKDVYQVIPASSVAKMFEILKTVTVDLILLDIEMPEVNGFKALTMLKTDDRYVEIPVIILTATDDDNHRHKGILLGAVDYIIKPFEASEVITCIEKQLFNHATD